MKNTRKPTPKDDFIAPALRAFRRVARNLRAESDRFGIPLIEGEFGSVKLMPVSDTSAR